MKLYQINEAKPKFALLKTEIIKADDSQSSLILPVNSNGFMIKDVKTFRLFFNIDFSENLGEILQQFNKYFSSFIPIEVNPNKSETLKETMVSSLSRSDSQDPTKIYCFTVKRNPNNNTRTVFNDNKTKLLRPNLYLKFKEDTTISFCYSQNKNDEDSDEEILLKFINRT